jgi:bacterioferritin
MIFVPQEVELSDKATLDFLNKAVKMEMTAAHQYQLHAHVLDDWGLDKLATQMRTEMAEELVHSDQFIERIIFLGGKPEVDFYRKPIPAQSLVAMFKADLADEEEAVSFYSEAARHALEVGDIGTRTLFEKTVLDEEGHKSWLELQLNLIERIGEEVFSANFVSALGAGQAG